jgi:hypothetical protein
LIINATDDGVPNGDAESEGAPSEDGYAAI